LQSGDEPLSQPAPGLKQVPDDPETGQVYYRLPPDWYDRVAHNKNDLSQAKPFIELLIDIRAELRNRGAFELADEIRDRMAELDIVLEDGPEETVWSRE
jgi:cysteinyl-tRNA synthetase